MINSTSKSCTAVWKKLAEKIMRLCWILWMQNVFVVFVRFGGATAALAATLGRQRCIGWKTELRVSFLTFSLHQPAGKGIILTVATRWCHVLHLYEELMINLACRTHIHKHTHTHADTQTHTCSPLGPHRIPALEKIEPNSEIATLVAVVGPGSHVTTAGLGWIQQVAKDW